MLKLDKKLVFLRCFMKKILSLLICLMSISLMSSCGTNNHENEVLVTDMSGAEVWVPKNPKKVAAVSPSTGDLMIAFGLGDVLDGTYYSVMDNPWAEVIYPKTKDLFGYDYDNSVETFIERGADLIFIPEPATAQNLREHGLNALCVRQFAEEGYGDYVFAFSEIVRTIWGEKVNNRVDMWQTDFNKAISDVTQILEENDISQAAVCSSYAAQVHGLSVLVDEINDDADNSTRFIVVTNQKVFLKDASKISIRFELPHQSGSLYGILSHFIYNDLNMTKIESRPIKGRPWEYCFFVDFEGNLEDPAVKNAVRGLREESQNLRILGNY